MLAEMAERYLGRKDERKVFAGVRKEDKSDEEELEMNKDGDDKPANIGVLKGGILLAFPLPPSETKRRVLLYEDITGSSLSFRRCRPGIKIWL